MNDYKELRIEISPCSEDGTDVMAYLLAEAGFESFVPDDKGITAYIKAEDYDPVTVNNALSQYPFAAALEISSKLIEGRDWNKEWEKNYFQPIVIGNECVVHSSFHTDIPSARYDIVIDPKMAFGTGHHATTSQVVRKLLASDLKDKTVIDMGTGTGILAILSVMLGAKEVYGIEIDEFAYTNALENVKLNKVDASIKIINSDVKALVDCPKADFFIANINRNVITTDIAAYAGCLKPSGSMILSGFYESDIPVIMDVARPLGFSLANTSTLDNWACITLKFDR